MFTIEKTDRRMSGHKDFKYRVKFIDYDNNTPKYINAKQANRDFLACTRYMTEKYGFGPELRLVHFIKEEGGEVPLWATRHAYQALHTSAPDTIYLRDDDAREKFEAILTFLKLKAK
jgi:hypothetical protein